MVGGRYKKNWAKISEDDAGPRVEILTKKGERIFVSLEDAEIACGYTWYVNKDGYAQTNKNKQPVLLHRILTGAKAGEEVDHRDLNKLNCTKLNLRIVTRTQNMANRVKNCLSKNRYKGVWFNKRTGKWRARIHSRSKRMSSGYFATEEEAARAYDMMARWFYGQYARVNFPENAQESQEKR